MKIKINSVFVDDQAKAFRFYTEVLGFMKKADMPAGPFRWLTVVSPEEPDRTDLLLEPKDNPATRTYQQAIFEQGIPATSFAVEDLHKGHVRQPRTSGAEIRRSAMPSLPQRCASLTQGRQGGA